MNERLKELAVQARIYYRTTSDEFCEADKDGVLLEMMERFADLVRADEREACAKIALKYEPTEQQPYVTYAADEIRARGKK